MVSRTVGIVTPGTMGSAVAAAARTGGARVVWASQGRSAETRDRAATDGLEDLGELSAVLDAADVVVSLCPPHAATEVAEQIAAAGYAGVFVDGNAVSPMTMQAIVETIAAGGARVVDGSVIGPPPREPDTTRLFLAGGDATDVAGLFAGSHLETVVLDEGPPAASALKMAYAGWSKGSAGLLLTMRAYASHAGVEEALVTEWARSQPGLAERSERAAGDVGPKAWRWVGEMEEIAAALGTAELPESFHLAAAEVFHRLRGHKGGQSPSIEEVAADLLGGGQ